MNQLLEISGYSSRQGLPSYASGSSLGFQVSGVRAVEHQLCSLLEARLLMLLILLTWMNTIHVRLADIVS